MKLIKQLPRECALASVCMVTGKSYPHHSQKFHKLYGFMFGDACASLPTSLVATRFYLDQLLGHKTDWFVGNAWDFPPLPKQQVSLAGQGLISVIRGYQRHTMAFSQGRLYDPNPKVLRLLHLSTWLRNAFDWRVYNITQVTPGRK